MTRLSLKNPIAILMICIGLVVFAGGGHAAHERRHVPRAHAAGAGRRHAGARPRPQGRREDHHLAHREVRERHARRRSRRERLAQQPQRRLRVAQVGHRPQLGADAGAAAGRVRDVGGARSRSACCRRSSCSTIRRTRRSCRSRSRAAGSPGRSSTTTRSTTSSPCSRASPASRARRSTAAGSARSTSSSIRSRAQARGVTSTRRRRGGRAVERALAVGRVHLAEVRRQRLHERRRPSASPTIGDARRQAARRQARC